MEMPAGTLTFDELYEHYKREGFYGITHFERVKAKILAHREPEYPTGTVVRDERGMHYFLTADRRWLMFGSNTRYDYDSPKRPLKVVS